ncbi:MAG: hypothetical protein ABSH52_08715 [Terriglobia bacterium]|jgi:hypothetical protein
MFVRLSVKLDQGFAHHHELCLAVTFEYTRVPLPEHLRDEMIGNPSRAEPCGKGVVVMPRAA